MTHTFPHIGDFHAKSGPRNADRYRVLDEIIDQCIGLPNLGAWLWPGDLDDSRMGIEDKNALSIRAQRMASVAPLVVCYGNHDLPGDLDFLARLKAAYPIYVVAEPTILLVTMPSGQPASLFVLPYPTRAGLTAMGVAPSDVIDTARQMLDSIFVDAAHQLRKARDTGHVTLMIGHVNVAGSLTSVGQPNIGKEIEIDRAMLDRFGFIYKGLNHIHVAQEIDGAHYVGSVCRLNWGEIEEKRYLTIDIDQNSHQTVCSHPLNVPPMYHVDGLLTRDDFVYQVTAGPGGALQEKPSSWRGCEVRVRYRFKQSEKSVISEARVLAEFADALRFEREPIAIPDRTLRAPEVAAARTMAEKIVAWCNVTGVVASDSVLAKLALLEHRDPTLLLGDVEQQLDVIEHGEQKETVAA
jgi:DNA repair exonuclease SbcCD nuclease subunit